MLNQQMPSQKNNAHFLSMSGHSFRPKMIRNLNCELSNQSLSSFQQATMSTFLLRFQPLARDWPRLGSSLLSLPSSLPPSRIGSSSKLFQLAIVAECNRRHLGSIAKNNSSSRSARLVLVNQAGLPHPSQVFFDLIST